jgi:hypothetical protein
MDEETKNLMLEIREKDPWIERAKKYSWFQHDLMVPFTIKEPDSILTLDSQADKDVQD